MRILMLSQTYPPVIGGEEQYVRNLSAELARRGHEVAVATIAQGPATAETEVDQEGVRVYRLRASTQRMEWLYTTDQRLAPPLPDLELVLGLRRVIKRERPDVVHAHNWLVHSFLPLKAWSRARLVMSLHDYSLVCAQKRLMRRGIASCDGPGVRQCVGCTAAYYGPTKGPLVAAANRVSGALERRAVDRFLPVSHAVAAKSGLVNSGLPWQVIPNFVRDDVAALRDRQHPCLAQLPSEEYLLFVGDLTRDKGVEVLLRAYAELPSAPPLVLIGQRCKDTPQEVPSNVIMLQNWPHGAVLEAWQRSSIGLVPSVVADACPTVVMEAMAAGAPVVASRIGGIPDLVAEGETGFLIPAGDHVALRERIAQLLGDQALLEQMGDAALRRVVGFQAGAIVPRIERVYQELVAGRAHRATVEPVTHAAGSAAGSPDWRPRHRE